MLLAVDRWMIVFENFFCFHREIGGIYIFGPFLIDDFVSCDDINDITGRGCPKALPRNTTLHDITRSRDCILPVFSMWLDRPINSFQQDEQ
jgi:hypothetical protein